MPRHAGPEGAVPTGRLFLVTGPVRSGKSAFARRLAEAGSPPVTFLATLSPSDPEMEARIARHRAERPRHWRTVEPPADVLAALHELARLPGTLLLDSLGGLVAAGALAAVPPSGAGSLDPDLASRAEDALLAGLDAAVSAVRAGLADLIVVAEQVGWDVVPPSPAGRFFRDLMGVACQRLAACADASWLLVAGQALPLAGPIRALSPGGNAADAAAQGHSRRVDPQPPGPLAGAEGGQGSHLRRAEDHGGGGGHDPLVVDQEGSQRSSRHPGQRPGQARVRSQE